MPDICGMETKTSYPKEKINVLLLENISEIAVKKFSKKRIYANAALVKSSS